MKPHTLNLYEYCANDPVNASDPIGFADKVEREEENELSWLDQAQNIVEGAVTHAMVFTVAATNAYSSDQVLGIGRKDVNNVASEYQITASLGQVVGDTTALVQGALEMAGGGTLLGGSVAISPAAVAAAGPTFGATVVVDGASAVVDAGMLAHGSITTITSSENLYKSLENMLSFSKSAEHTKNARPSTIEKHQKGKANKKKSRGWEKGDKKRRVPRKRPHKHKVPWPPKPKT